MNPDALISIHALGDGSLFSASGNTVSFHQIAKDFKLPRDNRAFWSESPSQITISIPPARRPGWVWFYVTDARGIDSDARVIELVCADCPRIDESCGVLNATDPMMGIEPGAVISITGAKFSPSGNRVVIEILGPGQVTSRRQLPRKNILSESPTRIIAKLPDDLPLARQAALHVINRQGLESRESAIVIAHSCKGCAPQWRPCRAVVNEGGGDFLAGTPVTLFGLFSATGNKAVIEQTDQRHRAHQFTVTAGAAGWSESADRIRFALPTALFPGRAALYVVDAEGRETPAMEIKIRERKTL